MPEVLCNVKRYCGMCRQHGLIVETRGHNCIFKNCDCKRCLLVRQRRKIMRTQIRLRRAQDKRFQRTLEPQDADLVPLNQPLVSESTLGVVAVDGNMLLDTRNMCYFCQKCKNHGVLMWKKDHKRFCRFTNCECDQCVLIETRRKLDQHLKSARYRNCQKCSKGVIEYVPSSAKHHAQVGSEFSQNSVSVTVDHATDESDATTKSAFSSLRNATNIRQGSLPIIVPTFSSSSEVPASYPTPIWSGDTNSFVILQLAHSGSAFTASVSSSASSEYLSEQLASPYSSLQQNLSRISKANAKDFCIYNSFLPFTQSWILREKFDSVVL